MMVEEHNYPLHEQTTSIRLRKRLSLLGQNYGGCLSEASYAAYPCSNFILMLLFAAEANEDFQ
jgi:hypothetical protein